MTDYLRDLGERAKAARIEAQKLSAGQKNTVLFSAAEELVLATETILEANEKDVQNGLQHNMPQGLVDRLRLTPERIEGMADGLRQVARLEDPIGEVVSMKKRLNGLLIGQKRVPLGVVGMIYEARPNVTSDTFGLCFKTGNAVILKGGSDAIHSNREIVKVLRCAIEKNGINPDVLQFVDDTSRETAAEFMKMNGYLDVLIPRGGRGLIQAVVNNSTVPVIETGTGNCHIFVDETADQEMACRILVNAKTQRIGVCNAAESLVVHKNIAESFLPKAARALAEAHEVELRADEEALPFLPQAKEAVEADWGTEYLDYILSVKVVSNLDEAIEHINRYNSGHSEAIITNDYNNAQRFLDEIDAAAVYVNASTRFTDGNEFGFGAEIGISTQKLHARGPMGLLALTTTKFIIYGNGQIRP